MTPDSTDTPPTGPPPDMWHGLDECMDTPGVRGSDARRVPGGRGRVDRPGQPPPFLTLMGASLALAGAAGCNRRAPPRRGRSSRTPRSRTRSPPACRSSSPPPAPLGGYGTGVLVSSHEGRPIKVEGNPDHPSSLGGTDSIAQASLLDLYDPDRSQARHAPRHRRPATTRPSRPSAGDSYDADGSRSKAAGLRILTETVTSPTLAGLIDELLDRLPRGEVGAVRAGQPGQRPRGRRDGVRPAGQRRLRLHQGRRRRSSLDSDFLRRGPGARPLRPRLRQPPQGPRPCTTKRRDGVDGRRQMNRLYAVESMLTGDRGGRRPPAAAASRPGRGVRPGPGRRSSASPACRPPATLPDAGRGVGRAARRRPARRSKGKRVVVAGDHQPPSRPRPRPRDQRDARQRRQDGPVHRRRSRRGPAGKVDRPARRSSTRWPASRSRRCSILGGEPGVHRPGRPRLRRGAQERSPFTLHLGSHQDETAVLCDWHVNEAHYLETWGDVRGHDGTVDDPAAAHRPALRRQVGHRVARRPADRAAPSRDGCEIVKAYWRKRLAGQTAAAPATSTPFWQESVRTGVVAGTAAEPAEGRRSPANWAEATPPAAGPAAGDLEINFRPDPTLYDGRFANNGWLQELPKPITKLTWDNAAFVSPKTADEARRRRPNFRWTGGEHGRAEVERRRADGRRPQRSRRRCGSCPATPTTRSPSTSATAASGPGRSATPERAERRGQADPRVQRLRARGRPTRRGSPAG